MRKETELVNKCLIYSKNKKVSPSKCFAAALKLDKSKYSQFDSGVSNHSFQDQFGVKIKHVLGSIEEILIVLKYCAALPVWLSNFDNVPRV